MDIIRNLATTDLFLALKSSNADLERQFNLTLRDSDELYDLAVNTEQSVYNAFKDDPNAYIETLLVYILMLTDPALRKDSIMFRLLVNVDIEDIYTEGADFVFIELSYASMPEHLRDKAWKHLTMQIETKLPELKKCYTEQRQCTLTPLYYKFPMTVKRAIGKYRDKNIDTILDEISKYSPNTDSSPYINNITADIEPDYDAGDIFASPVGSPSASPRGSPAVSPKGSPIPDMAIARLSDKPNPEFIKMMSAVSDTQCDSDSDAEPDAQPDSDSDNAPPDAELAGRQCETYVSATQDITSMHKCHTCSASVSEHTSYKTPLIVKNEPTISYFCGKDCMEQWDP